jgi:hypothetical protein
LSLETDLAEWRRWLDQGSGYGVGYPSEACTESLAIPYKRCDTAQEQLEDFMSTRSADELVGARVDSWVRSLYEPMRAAIQVRYVHMPDDKRWQNLSHEMWQERRARHCARLWSDRCGTVRVMTVDQFDSALSLAMDLLRDLEMRAAAGV